MNFHKACQNVFHLVQKNLNLSSKSLAYRFHSTATVKTNTKYSRHSNVIYVAAAASALGCSLFITYKKNIFCETADIINNENLIVANNKIDKLRAYIEPTTLNEASNRYEEEIRQSRDILQRFKDENGIPGVVIGVSINGKIVWTEGLGYADIENRVPCSADTVMRIASISKSITMAAVAKLWEQGKLDLDKPVQDYVPYFPLKTYDGKPVTITCRQLVSHLGGIRSYHEKNGLNNKKGESKGEKKSEPKTEKFEYEYYIKDHYKDVKSSLDIFKDDPLIAKPGSKYVYSTHGWTLISAIVESASKEQFSVHITKLFKALGMKNTYLDENDVLIYHRSRNYTRDKNGQMMNAPYVDNSYKWAGGGFLSTVGDLIQFGNAMLYSFQYKSNVSKNKDVSLDITNNIKNNFAKANMVTKDESSLSHKQNLPGFLNSKTVEAMWSPVTDTKEGKYGMGWALFPEVKACQFCETRKFCAFHTGGAIGASSVLLILPHKLNESDEFEPNFAPKGVTVAILANLQSVRRISKTAEKIAEIFDKQSVK